MPPRMSAYSDASKAVFAVFEDTTPLVEGLSIDEAFLDVRGLERIAGSPSEIAVRLRRRVLDEVGLPITVGVARTKFLAKVASGVAKPNGLLVVPPDRELAFLHPLPVERLWGVGRVTARSCTAAASGRSATSPRSASRRSWRCSAARRGDTSTRSPRTETLGRSASAAGGARSARSALGTRPRLFSEIDATGGHRRSARPPPARGRPGLPDGRPAASLRGLLPRDAFVHDAAADRADPGDPRHRARAARGRDADDRREGLTLIGISLSNLTDATPFQLALPFDDRLDTALDEALDEVRDRFGSTAVTRGSSSAATAASKVSCCLTDRKSGAWHRTPVSTGHLALLEPCSASQASRRASAPASATPRRRDRAARRGRSAPGPGSASARPDSR